MDRWRGRVAVVTGASEGIGEAIVRRLAAEGMRVAALARRGDLLKEIETELTAKKFFVRSHVCDVTNDPQVKEAFAWVEQNLGPVSVLVNNAACFKLLPLTNLEVDAIRAVIDTNLSGVLETTLYGLQSMKSNSITDGHIVNINSICGHRDIGYTGVSVYAATKHGLTFLNSALKRELGEENTKIRVTSVSPGLVRTSMSAWYTETNKETCCLESEDVADTVIYALSVPPHVNITELTVEAA